MKLNKLVLFVALTLIFSLAFSCNKDTTPTTTKTPDVEKGSQPKETPVFTAKEVKNQLLYDFRTSNKTSAQPKIPEDISKKVLSLVFTKYLKAGENCPPQTDTSTGEPNSAKLIEEGQIAPEIIFQVEGSFTAPGVKEKAYLVQVNECIPASRNYFGTMRLVVLSNDKLVANVEMKGNNGAKFLGVYDTNQNGISEILIKDGVLGQGTLEESARLVELKNNKLEEVKNFESIYVDSCGTGQDGSSIEASEVYYSYDSEKKTPIFTTKDYTSDCSDDPNAKPKFKLVEANKPK